MKNKLLKVIFIIFFILFSYNIVNAADTYTLTNITEKINDVYVVKYGETITVQSTGSVTIKSNDTSKARVIEEKKVMVIGTGEFTLNINSQDVKFFSWNACLKNGKYWSYKDENQTSKYKILYSKAYLNTESTNSGKMLKIVSHITKGNDLYNKDIDGKYIINYYNKTKKISISTNFDYSLEKVKVPENLEIHFIDPNSRVDAIYIKVGDKSIFIDGGFYRDAKSEIAYLQRLGVTHIDYYIGSHGHQNHVGAAGPIIKTFGIGTFITGRHKYSGEYAVIYNALKHADTTAEKNAIKACEKIILSPGSILNINGLKITCLGPTTLTKIAPGETHENYNSLILRMDYGNTSFLMAGDTSATRLKEANTKYPGKLNVDLYKNSHHNGALSESVYKLIKPTYLVVTTQDGRYLSSSYQKIVKKYTKNFFTVTTKKDRNVFVTSDGEKIKITTKYNISGVTPINAVQ